MGYWCEFAPAYGFHQGFVHPYPRTHGCIRLHGEAAPKFFALVRIGTPVNIATTQPEDDTLGPKVGGSMIPRAPDPDPRVMITRGGFPPSRAGVAANSAARRWAPIVSVSTNLISSGTTARKKVNLRTPEVMAAVQEQVESHYRSDIVDKIRRTGGIISVGDLTVRLAKQFGFCYGVERAIDLAYAARKVFKDRRLFIVGEIIHNPEVNEQISSLGIKNLIG